MPTIIQTTNGKGYKQSPYLFNNFGFKVIISNGNTFEGITAKSEKVWFFEWIKERSSQKKDI